MMMVGFGQICQGMGCLGGCAILVVCLIKYKYNKFIENLMFSAIHSLKSPPKQRSKSQNVTQRTQQAMLKTFIERRTTPNQHILKKPKNPNLHTNPHLSVNLPTSPTANTNTNHYNNITSINMNMLLNGKSLQQVTSTTKYKTIQNSPKQIPQTPNIRQYIYKKYLTEHQQQFNPHAEGIIRLRQMFNQRINRSKANQMKQVQSTDESRWPKLQIYKVTTSITDPDLNNVSYISRARKYEQQQQPNRDRYYRIFRNRQFQKKQSLTPYTVQDRSHGLTIQPWETD